MADRDPKQEPPILSPPLLHQPAAPPRGKALNAIIIYKLFRGFGLLLIGFAFVLIPVADLKTQIADVFRQSSSALPVSATGSGWLDMITPQNLRLLTIGSVVYGWLSWAEGVGLFLRAAWAVWITIGESAMFLPLEVWQLAQTFSAPLLAVLVLNVWIVWFLYQNRERFARRKLHGQA